MCIGKICRRDVISLSEKSSIKEAATLMAEKNTGSIVIMDNDKREIVGILTDRDIVINAIAKEKDLQTFTVKEAMSKDLLVIKADEGIKKTLDLMCEKGVRRGPIVDADNKLYGMITVDDLVCVLADELKIASTLICNQIKTVNNS